MSIFISVISILLAGMIPALIGAYLMNSRKVEEFKRLANVTNLNFALPQRKKLLEAAQPALVGEYRNRSVNMVSRKSPRTNKRMTELVMNCNTGTLRGVIELKRGMEEDYIYQVHSQSQFTPMLTKNAEFDKRFFLLLEPEEALHLFTKEVCDFLLKHAEDIPFRIEIRGYEIIIDDADISQWERTEGGIAENAVYMLNFLSELADLLERKKLN